MLYLISSNYKSGKDLKYGSYYRFWRPTRVSRALQSPQPICQYKFKLKICYHVKEHEKLCKNPKKIDPFKAKKVTTGQSSDLGHFPKNEKDQLESQSQARMIAQKSKHRVMPKKKLKFVLTKRLVALQRSGHPCPSIKPGPSNLIVHIRSSPSINACFTFILPNGKPKHGQKVIGYLQGFEAFKRNPRILVFTLDSVNMLRNHPIRGYVTQKYVSVSMG